MLSALTGEAAPAKPRALWVWDNESWRTSPARKELLDFARERGITEFFTQVSYTGRTLEEPEVFRALLRECHAQQIRVHALDGYPEAVLPASRTAVVNLARAVMAFNAASKPGERFDGLHLDNEPYLLPAYGGRLKRRILSDYVELNSALAGVLRGSGLDFGVDIPFWFDNLKVAFRGTERSVTEHVLGLVDNIGIMDYRNKADGPDGLISHARDEVEWAGRAGKRVYIGVETLPPTPSPKVFLWGFPEAEWDGLNLFTSRFEGFRVATLEAAGRELLGLSVPDGPERRAAFGAALVRLRGVLPPVPEKQASELLRKAENFVRANREYEGFEPFYFEGEKRPAGFKTASRGLAKITFAGKSPAIMERELAAVAEAFKDEPGFYGFAIHHYGSYREIGGQSPQSPDSVRGPRAEGRPVASLSGRPGPVPAWSRRGIRGSW